MFTPLSHILEDIDPKHRSGLPELQISHVLKCWPLYFNDCRLGIKGFDLRKREEGRIFIPHQYIIFREWDPKEEAYSGRWDLYHITYVFVSEEAMQFGFEEGLGGDILGLIHVLGN